MHVLRALAIVLRLDTLRLECRHASIRRIKLVASQTHTQSLEKASAHFVMARQRILEAKAGTFPRNDVETPLVVPDDTEKAAGKAPKHRGRPHKAARRVQKKGKKKKTIRHHPTAFFLVSDVPWQAQEGR